MRSLFCVFVVGWIGLVLSFQLASLHQRRRQILTPISGSPTPAKFHSTITPKFQPTVCFSSAGSSSRLKSLIKFGKDRFGSVSGSLPQVPVASLKEDHVETQDENGVSRNAVSPQVPVQSEANPDSMKQKNKIKKSFLIRLSRVNGDTHKNSKDELTGSTASTRKATVKWSDSEMTTLRELVTKQLQPVWSDAAGAMVTPKEIGWVSIGKVLGRLPAQCRNKWRNIKFENQGPFTAEEDALILQRVEEWGVERKGLWTAMSKELHRSLAVLRNRWFSLRTDRPKQLLWTEEMHTALVNAYNTEKEKPKKHNGILLWDRVSMCVRELGWVITPHKCHRRYQSYGKKTSRTTVMWTPELVQSLNDMRERGMRWCDIGAALNILPEQCTTKWHGEHGKSLKRGKFTPEEDALIRQRVTEWHTVYGEKQGLWEELRRETGRPANSLWSRWHRALLLKE